VRHGYGGYDWRKRKDLILDKKAELDRAMIVEWSVESAVEVMLVGRDGDMGEVCSRVEGLKHKMSDLLS
jgi:hypothetical protein